MESQQSNNLPADLAASQIAVIEEAGAIAGAKRQEAEIQSAMVIAKRFPRDEEACEVKIMRCFQRVGMAESAEYVYPRGGAKVRGPSVYSAREMARCWGNLRYGVDVVSETEQKVHIKGWCFDLESNTYVTAEDKFSKLVQRKRNGQTQWVSADERDLRELINKRGAMLVRNSILQIIPRHITDAAMYEANATLKKKAAGQLKDSPEDIARKLIKAFADISVTKDQLVEYLGREVSQIDAEQYVDLQGIYKSIKDGNSKREEYFDLSVNKKVDEINEKLKASPKKEKDSIDSEVLGNNF